ncbi:MAG TPA: ABC transporter permease [Candidatus Fimimonas gallinarum]|uniref:ABC transporter permease n=2 Tax=Candidatus Fimimonas TaxID=2840648 RepID=A0A9D1E487_9BACT|nr:ABC transporter permease [Candidatus Fimimonas gallinarum]
MNKQSELRKMSYLTLRNIKLYFKDKMTFLVSLITPLILLVLFIAFLKSTYEDSILSIIQGFDLDQSLIDALTGGWLFSSVLATSCITIAFCSGMMVIDKINRANIDFMVSPVKKSTLQLSYVLANLFSTFIITFVLLIVGLIYLACVGFYITFVDILLIVFGIIITSLFGTILANIIWTFSHSQGVVSGVCTLVSALYGFICGAYMPIRTMGQGMQYFVSLLPGTYATVLFRQGFLNSVLNRMRETLPQGMINGIASGFDVKMSFFGHDVSTLALILVISISTIVLLGVFLFINKFKKKN